jgi:hypothetical protein
MFVCSPLPARASRRPAVLALLVALALVAAPALAQTPQILDEAPASDNGRYAMQQTPEGFLRLDTRTGKVSLCTVKEGAARCALAADERDAYDREIATLKAERDAARAGGRLTQDAPAQDKSTQDKSAQDKSTQDKSAQDKSAGSGPRLPTDAEIDRTLSVMEKIWRGMNKIIGEDAPTQKGGQL